MFLFLDIGVLIILGGWIVGWPGFQSHPRKSTPIQEYFYNDICTTDTPYIMSHKGRVFYHAYHKTYGRSDKRWRSDRWNIWGNSGTIYRKIVAHGRDLSDFIFSDFEPWKFVIALYKISLCKTHCYSSWAFICSKVELLTRTWALNNFDRSYGPGILHNLLIVIMRWCTYY